MLSFILWYNLSPEKIKVSAEHSTNTEYCFCLKEDYKTDFEK